MSIARTSAIDAGSQAAAIAMSMGAGIVLSRVLGAEGQGVYILATTTASLLLLNAANLGLGLSLQVHVAREPGRAAELHTFALLFSILAGGLVGGALLALSALVRETILKGMDPVHLAILAAALPFALYQFCCFGMLNGLGAVRQRALLELAIGGVQAITLVTLLLVGGKEFILYMVLAYYVITAAGAIGAMWLVGRQGKLWRMPRWELIRRVIGYGKWVYGGNLASRLRVVLDQLLVNFFGGGGALGVYHRGAGLAGRSSMFARSLESASYRPISASDPAEGARLAAAAFRQMLILGVGITLLGWAAAPLIPLIYGPDFVDSVGPFRVLVPAFCLVGAARMLAIYFSGCLARPQIPMAINWITVAFQIAVTLELARRFGPLMGVTWGAAAAQALTAALFVAMFIRRPETPGTIALIRITREDVGYWKKLLPRRRRAG